MIQIQLIDQQYEIVVADSYQDLPKHLERLKFPKEVWIVSHKRLLNLWQEALCKPLTKAGYTINVLSVPESEKSKSIDTLMYLVQKVVKNNTMKVPGLIAFGGGVVGDLTGFAAATLRRGVPYIQVPTSLLAQVDSSIGGKVGIDLPEGKNLLGAYYHPKLVWCNSEVLQSLPAKQIRSGLGEIIKYGAIADKDLFQYIENHLEDCLSLKPNAVKRMVKASAAIKADVVTQDEKETKGMRLFLNFGHTLGHALETATQYERWTHGEAIAIGMCYAAKMSVDLGHAKQADLERLTDLFEAAGLPVAAEGVSAKTVLKALKQDKKFISGKPRWVLMKRIGQVFVSEDVPMTLVEKTLKQYIR